MSVISRSGLPVAKYPHEFRANLVRASCADPGSIDTRQFRRGGDDAGWRLGRLLGSARAHERFDKAGKLTHQGSQKLVVEQFQALVAFVDRVRSPGALSATAPR